MSLRGNVYVGTSGWMYKDWGKHFYPPNLKRGHLAFLAQEFRTVEINSSFYHLPLKSTFKKWCEETPAYFMFAVKLSRFITHKKKLKGVRAALERFIRHAKPMQAKFGVLLIQLPPFLTFDAQLLQTFLEDIEIVLARNYSIRIALEPRHESWMHGTNAEVVRKELGRMNIALVFPHSRKIPSFPPTDENRTADFAYVRFHGPSEFAASKYGARRLKPWIKRIQGWAEKGADVFIYFNNDVHGHAIEDARTIKRQLKAK